MCGRIRGRVVGRDATKKKKGWLIISFTQSRGEQYHSCFTYTTPPMTSLACKEKTGSSNNEGVWMGGDKVGGGVETRGCRKGANEGQEEKKKKRRSRKDVSKMDGVLRMKGSKGREGVTREKAN